MLVYGDHRELAGTAERLGDLRGQLARVAEAPAGLDRHGKLVAALIEAGRLLQGVADADFAERGHDRRTEAADALGEWVCALARAVCRSWTSGFEETGDIPQPPRLPAVPAELELRLPEGFAFYAVYPEAYLEAARRLVVAAPARVIGIRSIGTTLGAVVAAALGAPPPTTVRPFGAPFARQIAVAPELARELLARGVHYVIVDEGPGQSGSSFGAVADWLQERGVPLDRIAFIPSHPGDVGPEASDATRRRWRKAQRVPAQFDARWLEARFGPLEEFSSGHPFAMRKFLSRGTGRAMLLKFAGLGAIGERKLAMARALHRAGLTPEPLGLVHGFLVERWRDDAAPLARGEKPLAEIARYIAARAQLFPAGAGEGAPLARLQQMIRRNVCLALGEDAARALDCWEPGLERLERRVVRVRTDNRLDRQEWLRVPGGALLKADALDHHLAHDLVGCQDMAWDVAGAAVEFSLSEAEAAELIRLTERASARPVEPDLLQFYRLAYLAFRVGREHLAARLSPESGPIHADEQRYRNALRELVLERTPSATRPESLVG
ncbi:MAG: hypothetical protein ACJ8FL_06870 [Sphingomicrobium sp.]